MFKWQKCFLILKHNFLVILTSINSQKNSKIQKKSQLLHRNNFFNKFIIISIYKYFYVNKDILNEKQIEILFYN